MKVIFTVEVDDLSDKLVKEPNSSILVKFLILNARVRLPDGAVFAMNEGVRQSDTYFNDPDTGIARKMTREEVRSKLAATALAKAGAEVLRVYGEGIPSEEKKKEIMGRGRGHIDAKHTLDPNEIAPGMGKS